MPSLSLGHCCNGVSPNILRSRGLDFESLKVCVPPRLIHGDRVPSARASEVGRREVTGREVRALVNGIRGPVRDPRCSLPLVRLSGNQEENSPRPRISRCPGLGCPGPNSVRTRFCYL